MPVCKIVQGGLSRRRVNSPSALALAIAGVAATVALKALHGVAFAQPRGPALYSQQKRSAAVALRARGGDDEEEYDFGGIITNSQLLVPGQEIEGVISRYGTNRQGTQFGVFVDIGVERDGLVSMGRLSTDQVDKIEDTGLQVGDAVKTWVVSVTEDRISLSLVRSKTLPRADVADFENCDENEWLSGYVAKVMDFGAFVALRPPSGELAEAQGLVYRTQIKDGEVDNVADELSVGQDVNVRVVRVDPSSNKMSLSMRKPQKSNDELYKPFTVVKSDEWLEGVVKSFVNFGAFVEATTPDGAKAQGLVHVSQIKDGFVEDPAEELEVDQKVKVRVLEVDIGAGKMGLSMREPAAEGEVAPDE